VTSCSGYGNSTTWCCGEKNTACCGQAGAITIAATVGLLSTLSSTVSSTISSSSTVVPTTSSNVVLTTSSTALSSVNLTSTSDGKALSVGTKAGIGVGVSLAGLAILGGIIWFVLERIQRRRGVDMDEIGHDSYFRKPELDGNTSGSWGDGEVAKVKEPQLRHELDGERGVELPVELLVELPT
jgi:hypothetical protein